MKLSNKLPQLTALTLLASISGSTLASNFSTEASATIASQYIWRGFDLNQEDPALQGDFVISHDSGFSLGVWGSNYDFGSDDGVEVDWFANYATSLTDQVSIEVGVTEYTFSGDSDSSTEYYFSVNFSYLTIAYYDDTDLDTNYLSVDLEFELVDNITLALHAGDNDPDNGESNNDYAVGINYSANKQLSLFATYSDNDLNIDGAEDYLVVGASYSF